MRACVRKAEALFVTCSTPGETLIQGTRGAAAYLQSMFRPVCTSVLPGQSALPQPSVSGRVAVPHAGAPFPAGSPASHSLQRRSASVRALAVEAPVLADAPAEPLLQQRSTDALPMEAVPPHPGQQGKGGKAKTDLRDVKGVGPINEAKLLSKQIDSKDKLKKKWVLERPGEWESMQRFLRAEVGIRKHHCQQIMEHIRRMQQEEQGLILTGQRKVTMAIEGNISAGKSSFLKMLSDERVNGGDPIQVVPEPVDKWQDMGPDHINMLDMFYKDPQRKAFAFQSYVMLTRMKQESESATLQQSIRLLERSVFSDRMVFVRATHEQQWMSDDELHIYDKWFEPALQSQPTLVPDGFIYLRAEPDTCLRRLHHRNRSEEAGVSMEYLEGLHEKHESWMFGEKQSLPRLDQSILLQSGLPQAPPEVPDILKGKVFYLDKRKQALLHPVINARPLLVLDCNQDIDVDNDLDAKRHYMDIVRAYCTFVRDTSTTRRVPYDLGPDPDSMNQFLDTLLNNIRQAQGKDADQALVQEFEKAKAQVMMGRLAQTLTAGRVHLAGMH